MNTDDGIHTVEVDEPGGAGVRLSVAAVGICGTDVMFVGAGVIGFIYGHEFAGVDDTGNRYFVEPTIYGGECAECRAGNPQRCTEAGHGTLGIYRDGGLAEAVVVPEYTLLALPSQLDVKDACLVEPGAVAWHAVRRAQARPASVPSPCRSPGLARLSKRYTKPAEEVHRNTHRPPTSFPGSP
ncbi:alcohol dehydrogenase catalytic domain-containing protein [Nonomuraea sp. NPDC049784]|uniref:alcohol dehydrogenase catalytic domain-containing protein n=1 Tax=Nonomuraea sp. NPDC049784 TaxID=3154361 RepID=UPI0033F497A5